MGRDKSTILYELKFGFGASYRDKITNKSLTQIISCRDKDCSVSGSRCDSELFEDTQNPHIRIEGDIKELSQEASKDSLKPSAKSASFGRVSNRSRR